MAEIDTGLAGGWADRLIGRFGGVAPALAADPGQLRVLMGDPRAAAAIGAHRRAMLWVLREPVVARPLMTTRYELLRYLHHAMAFEPAETLRGFFVNARRELIAEEEIARGGPDSVAVEPRQVLARALALGASGVILVHNHPSGDPTPSPADRRFTRRLAQAGECLGIRLHDHLIVARDGIEAIGVTALATG